MKEKLQNIAKKNNCKIKNFDIWKTSGIAFDESENFLVGYRKTTEYEIDIFYNLQDFSNCKIVKTSRTELDNLVIENLKLVLTCKKNANKQETFEFYNVNTDSSQLGDEIELINKWHELILSKLK